MNYGARTWVALLRVMHSLYAYVSGDSGPVKNCIEIIMQILQRQVLLLHAKSGRLKTSLDRGSKEYIIIIINDT